MDFRDCSTKDMVAELIKRGAEFVDTEKYKGYRLLKRYSSDEREVSSRILILKDCIGVNSDGF